MKSNDTAGIPFTLGLFWEMLKASTNTSTLPQVWLFLNKDKLSEKQDPAELNGLLQLCYNKRGISNWCFFFFGTLFASVCLLLFAIKIGDKSDMAVPIIVGAIASFFLLTNTICNNRKDRTNVNAVEGRIKKYYIHFADSKIRWDDIHPAVRIYLTLVKREMHTRQVNRHENKGLFDLAVELLQGEDVKTLYQNVYKLIEALERSQVKEEVADTTLLGLVSDFLRHSSDESI